MQYNNVYNKSLSINTMALNLNETPQGYKDFTGPIPRSMPRLTAEGRVPMNISQIMQRRLDIQEGSNKVKNAWENTLFDTGDAIIYHPNGDIKLVLDSQTLREINLESSFNCGALVLDKESYNTLEGEVFKRNQMGVINNWTSKSKIKSNPILKFLARDSSLLNEYVNYTFAEGEKRFDYSTMMGVYLSGCYARNNPEMRLWSIGGIKSGSYILGYLGMDKRGTGCPRHLVGIAPKSKETIEIYFQNCNSK